MPVLPVIEVLIHHRGKENENFYGEILPPIDVFRKVLHFHKKKPYKVEKRQ